MLTRRYFTSGIVALAASSIYYSQKPALGQESRKRLRLPLDEFLKDQRLLKALRKGVLAMQQRKPSDPLSWFFQAAIHGVTSQAMATAASEDPDVLKVNHDKYWNQCPHNGQNSADFLPWHRAYTHHFEEILIFHAEEEDFAIPYWNYEESTNRTFPREFGIQHLDGNVKNDDKTNINPLFYQDRDYFLCGYEHPFTDQLPLTELSSRAVDVSRVMNAEVFFGDTESTGVGGGIGDEDGGTRGLLEQSPHDQIHRAVGGQVVGTDGEGNSAISVGAMAVPMTAGFDPIFPVHHANVDRLWKVWACKPGKSWGKLPDQDWFDEKPWYFFDVKGAEVNRPRKDYFDLRSLGIGFKDDDPTCQPLQLPSEVLTATLASASSAAPIRFTASQRLEVAAPIEVGTRQTTIVPLAPPSDQNAVVRAFNTGSDRLDKAVVSITLHKIDIAQLDATGFDVFLMDEGSDVSKLTSESPTYLGQINLFNHSNEFDQKFDATRALASLKRNSIEGLTLAFIPYALSSEPKIPEGAIPFRKGSLKASSFSITRGDSFTATKGPHRH